MSVKLMAIVWELDLPPGEKLVLLALADQANDHGTQCWPAVATIAKRSGQGVRTVRRALENLQKAGHLTRDHRHGTSTQYRVHPCQNGSTAKLAPLPKRQDTPAKLAATPAKLAPKPSITTNEPPSAESAIRASSEWKAFGAMRRQIRKPLNATAERRLIAKLLKMKEEDGWPPGEVLDQSTERCWAGVFPLRQDAQPAKMTDQYDAISQRYAKVGTDWADQK